MRAALVGMIVSWAAVALITSLPPIIALLIIAYFTVINGYAMLAFVRGAVRTSGVVRQRLRFAAAGSGLLALVLLLVGVANFIPAIKDFTGTIALVGVIGCGISYYVGFAPPRWLRRSWQFTELNLYLNQIASTPTNKRLNLGESMTALSTAASQAVGGTAAGIVQRDESEQQWILRYTVGDLEQIALDGDDVIGRS